MGVAVPFFLKHAVDTLNNAAAAAGSDTVLAIGTAPETVATVATSLLIGCKFTWKIILSSFYV